MQSSSSDPSKQSLWPSHVNFGKIHSYNETKWSFWLHQFNSHCHQCFGKNVGYQDVCVRNRDTYVYTKIQYIFLQTRQNWQYCNANIGIRGFTVWEQKIQKMLPQMSIEPHTSDSKSNTFLSEIIWYMVLRRSLNFCSCTTWFLDLDDLVRISRTWLRSLKSQSYRQMPSWLRKENFFCFHVVKPLIL